MLSAVRLSIGAPAQAGGDSNLTMGRDAFTSAIC